MEPNVEAVKKLKPTHVFVSTIKDEMQPFYKQLNLKATFIHFDSLKGMQKSITQLGDQFNRKAQSKRIK